MNIVFVSDIHANAEALRALKPVISRADLVMCLGDFIGYYCQVNEVLDFIRGLNTVSVRGNHDEYLLSGCPPGLPDSVRFGIEFADRIIDADHRRWLSSLPLVWGGSAGQRSFLLSHGSPFSPLTDYVYENRLADFPFSRFDFDLVALGQTHRSLFDAARRPLLLNPGSAGQSRDKSGAACAATLDTETMTVDWHEYSYDVQGVIALARENGAGPWITKHLVP